MPKVGAKPPPSRPATVAKPPSAGVLTLPTKKTKPVIGLHDYITMYFGPPGVGKTTFVNGFGERVLFLSTDRGTRFLSALREECLNWVKFGSVLSVLEKGQSKNYDFIVIDHVDDWASMAEAAVLKKLNVEALTDAGYGKGWSLLKKELKTFIRRLKALPCGIVFIAHERIEKIKVGGLDVDKIMPNMSKQAWNEIVPLCDLVGYCGMKPMKDNAGKRVERRVLITQPKQDLYAKDRTGRRKPEGEYESLDGAAFIRTFE